MELKKIILLFIFVLYFGQLKAELINPSKNFDPYDVVKIQLKALKDNNEKDSQLFVTGWIKRGPSGVIGTNRSDSIETVQSCLNEIENKAPMNAENIIDLLKSRNITYISYIDWKKIDALEIKTKKMSQYFLF